MHSTMEMTIKNGHPWPIFSFSDVNWPRALTFSESLCVYVIMGGLMCLNCGYFLEKNLIVFAVLVWHMAQWCCVCTDRVDTMVSGLPWLILDTFKGGLGWDDVRNDNHHISPLYWMIKKQLTRQSLTKVKMFYYAMFRRTLKWISIHCVEKRKMNKIISHSQLKLLLDNSNFLTWLVIGWQLCCQPITSHVGNWPFTSRVHVRNFRSGVLGSNSFWRMASSLEKFGSWNNVEQVPMLKKCNSGTQQLLENTPCLEIGLKIQINALMQTLTSSSLNRKSF